MPNLVENIQITSVKPNSSFISSELARRKANGYLTANVSLFIKADEPMLIPGMPVRWRMTTFLRLRGYGRVATVGFIDIDAGTGEVFPLSDPQIAEMKGRAEDAAASLEFSAAATS